ncbi:magnesium/cobalt transporter CorA [Nafulsella turpanensis]|uniref:magnesium/cobalt transporter CorA n=1 Tax=Nafulsella turpanensis TaxID=1265690 RepID=UPI000345F534|nr:magnesium/cobalt transporter CorA [Nafulsella turpanensis]
MSKPKQKKSAAKKAIHTARHMGRFFKNSSKKVGMPPGSLYYTGTRTVEPVNISLFNYDGEGLEEVELQTAEETFSYRDATKTSWININGVHDVELVEKVCKHYGIHPLTIEDIVSTDQRPKIEEAEGYIYVVLKMMEYDTEKERVQMEQVSLLLGKNFVLSFQEREGDTFTPVRERLRAGKGRIRTRGADYLLYALLDTVVDNYFVIMEKVGDSMAELEERLLVNATKDNFDAVYNLKREMLAVRRSTWPLREVIYKLEREDFAIIQKETQLFVRDVYDHMIQVIDTVETYRDLLSGMVDLYHSTVSTRTNDVMKVLTIISTIFIPLTFIVGVYGMNFEYMPELQWKYGYLSVWILMLLLLGGMVYTFRKKSWL